MKFECLAVALAATAAAGCCDVGPDRVRQEAGSVSTVRASSFGYDPVDSTRFLQAALDSGAKKVVVDRQAGDWITRPLFITNSNIEVVLEDGVTIRAKRGEFYGRNDCLIDINRMAHDVILRGEGRATLRMNKSDYLDPKQKYPFAEWRMGVNICRAKNVAVRNLTILSSGGDGVYVGGGAQNVLLDNLVCKDHNRQGISVTDARGLVVRHCVFDDTYGAPPQCGIDIEPNRESNQATDIIFEDCTFNGNASHGFDMYFGAFTAKTYPVSVVYRRCVARNNRGCGISFMTGAPKSIMEKGHVRGSVRFEDCEVSGNGGEALKIINHACPGMDIGFVGCTFDARRSKSESAFLFTNAQILKDFGNVSFENCRVLLDGKKKVCDFEAEEGIGIGVGLKGVLTVERDGKTSRYDLADFAAQHVPHPEKVSAFKSMAVDMRSLKAPPPAKLKGVRTPNLRGRFFVFVQAVPAAGEYEISFKSRFLRKNAKKEACAAVQLLDRAGTDLGRFDVPEGDFTYVLKANGPNVYRLEVSKKKGATMSVATTTPGGALLADRPINLFGGKNRSFYFRVPAGARDVQVNLRPEEPASAELFDASGKKVAAMPYQTRIDRFKIVREPSSKDEIWTLRFPNICEDLTFQVGGDAVPLLSTEREGVILSK